MENTEKLFYEILDEDEEIIKVIKPSKSRYWKFFLMPLIVPIFLPHFIAIMACTLFFIIPLLYAKSYNNLYYAFTNKRLIKRCGTTGISYKTLDYKNITSTEVKVGLLDKGKKKTGTLYFKKSNGSFAFDYVEDPYDLMREIEECINTVNSDFTVSEVNGRTENESVEVKKSEQPQDELKETEKVEQPQDELKEIEKAEQEQDKKDNRIAWLRFAMLHILVLIPIIIGVTCFLVGSNTDNRTLSLVGMLAFEVGVPVVMAILLTIVLVWKFRRRKPKPDATDEVPSQREHEQNMIDAVNSSGYYSSRAKLAAYETESVMEGMKHAPKWGLAVGLTCFFSLFALLIVATVLLINRIFVGAIVCAAIVGVILITTFIVMAVSRAKATNGDISKAKKITEGEVKACFMIGTTTTKSGGMRHGNGGTIRIQSVTYRVIVIADGVEYGAFSKQFYEIGETVTIGIMGKKRAKIVEDGKLETNDIQADDK